MHFLYFFAKMASVTELIEVLRARGEAAARELAAQLRLSQPQISRLIKAAGDRVCRIGKGRATRYALYRTIPNLGSRLPVREIDELGSVRAHGKLHLLASDRCWLEREDGSGQTYEGLPPFALDMCPQGYMGREFPAGHPDLDLPTRITDWNDDHRLIAIARRGEDCVGNLIVGDESFSQFLSFRLPTVQHTNIPTWHVAHFQNSPVLLPVANSPSSRSSMVIGICWLNLRAAIPARSHGGGKNC